ncbi:MAG: cupin domain-containing protein [Geobacteraceae bacterium]|nr:cupin domain-containing protein [Geobacteraceae bacterium]
MANKDIIRTDNVQVREMELATGEATGWHFHTQVNDYFVCLEGAVRVETKTPDNAFVLEPGQRFQVPTGQIHRVINQTCRAAKYLLVQGVGSYDFCPAEP